MSTLQKIRLVALDTDGVLLNDTYSPVIERFVTRHGGEYTAAVERGVWGSPQLAADDREQALLHRQAAAGQAPGGGPDCEPLWLKDLDLPLADPASAPSGAMPGGGAAFLLVSAASGRRPSADALGLADRARHAAAADRAARGGYL